MVRCSYSMEVGCCQQQQVGQAVLSKPPVMGLRMRAKPLPNRHKHGDYGSCSQGHGERVLCMLWLRVKEATKGREAGASGR